MQGNIRTVNQLSGVQKVAIMLLSIPEDSATKVFALMSDEEIKEVSYAMSNLGSIPPEVLDALLQKFNNDIIGDTVFLGNLQTTEKLLSKVLDTERARSLIDEIKGPQGKNTWEKLGNVNEELLALYLHNEHPQTAALVLSKISPDHAAKVLSNMKDDFAFDVIMRVLSIGSVKKEVLDRVERILRAEFISSIGKTAKQDSFEMIAEIFHNFDRTSEAKYMGMLEINSPESAQRIKDLMFTFEDLIKVDSKGLQIVFRSVDKQKLTVALKGASNGVREAFFGNMSERAARILMEEIESLGPVRVRDVDEAQSEIIKIVKDLIEKGEINVMDEGSDEYI
ncbi:MAG: flagellar motor switch protein FliG [Pseudomonadota bacterium]